MCERETVCVNVCVLERERECVCVLFSIHIFVYLVWAKLKYKKNIIYISHRQILMYQTDCQRLKNSQVYIQDQYSHKKNEKKSRDRVHVQDETYIQRYCFE